MEMLYEVDESSLLDFLNLANGVFAPLDGFCDSKDFFSIIDNYTLANGEIFTIPILLPVNDTITNNISKIENLEISFNGRIIGSVIVEDFFKAKKEDFYKLYGTDDENHPGLKKQLEKGLNFIGGKVVLKDNSLLDKYQINNPKKIKNIFKLNNWKTIVGFQTRNPIHRAHEYLQRVGLDVCDGLFINPLVGWKRKGDFTEEAILLAYNKMIEEFYPKNRVYFDTLRISMKYAGPREAIFHAIIRRNLGCTHFIIGRDHAGVNNYYGKYEAHELARKILDNGDLGIELLLLHEPYYCKKCEQIVTEKNCSHTEKDIIKISGTLIRKMLKNKQYPSKEMMRKEIFESIIKAKQIFIEGE
jgi:sulfate adenylyltransferase